MVYRQDDWHTSPEYPLGRQQREGAPQVEAHLRPEFGHGASASAVTLHSACLDDVVHHFQILHGNRNSSRSLCCPGGSHMAHKMSWPKGCRL